MARRLGRSAQATGFGLSVEMKPELAGTTVGTMLYARLATSMRSSPMRLAPPLMISPQMSPLHGRLNPSIDCLVAHSLLLNSRYPLLVIVVIDETTRLPAMLRQVTGEQYS